MKKIENKIIRNRPLSRLAISFFLLFFLSRVAEAQTWQQTLQQNFDWVMTFDDYDDWMPMTYRAGLEKDSNLDGTGYDGPVISGTTNGDIDTYDTWYTSKPPDLNYTLKNWGPEKTVTGKSYTIGYNVKPGVSTYQYYSQAGPNDNFIFFGEENNPYKYQEMYFFFRTYIPSNRWPTQKGGTVEFDTEAGGNPVVKHTPGNDYAYITSEKWINLGASRLNARDHQDLDNDVVDCCFKPYTGIDDQERWFHIKDLNDPSRQKQIILEIFNTDYNEYMPPGPGAYTGGVNITPFFDKLIGVEIRAKVESVAGTTFDGVAQVWFYDENGTATLVLNEPSMMWLNKQERDASGNNAGLNVLYLLSNCRAKGVGNSEYYSCGSGMECNYWLDDLIVDDQPIGPKYFSLLNGTTPLKGDVQCDKAVDILDVQALVNCILGRGDCDWGCGNSVDVVIDGSIDILDVQEVVNIILGW